MCCCCNYQVFTVDNQRGLRKSEMRPLSVRLHEGWLHRRGTQMNIAHDRERKRYRKGNCERRENLARRKRRARRRDVNVFFAAPIDRRHFWMAGCLDASPASGLQTNGFFFAFVLECSIQR
jgi:hypothetical protein